MRLERCLRAVWALSVAALAAACAPGPAPTVLPGALPAAAGGLALAGLPVPARVGLLRVADGRLTPIPATEAGRWRGAFHQVNAALPAPILALPAPASGQALGDDLGAQLGAAFDAAAAAGFDAVLVYELSVRAESDPLAAALSEVPMLGGAIPATAMTEAQAVGLAVLVEPAARRPLGVAEARLEGAPIAPISATGGSRRAATPLAAYAMVHALAPRVEDMLTEAVTVAIAARR